ncbi:hypothetical protein [Bosea sp. BK604]|uniref:hypothetical protein n=1 Tax=Bosea sp. BK604 TaxID=2512180 RepID=UPI0010501BA5|nr:hypothetical protein [Bosea sp. BK604]
MAVDDAREALAQRVEAARVRTLDWLATMQAVGEPRGVMRISAQHDPGKWPGMLLPGSYNGINLLSLIGGLDDWSADERATLVAWFERWRLSDGRFRIAGMTDDAVFKKPDRTETWRYIDFHVTNYSLGAIEALDPARKPLLAFAEPFLDVKELGAWLSLRDLRDPWQEGNNIVNLGSFLLLMARDGNAAVKAQVDAALETLFAWHDRLQEPSTGFWGVGQLSDPLKLLHAFAGSMHNFHLWYETGRPLPFHERALDYCLTLPPAIDSACIDVDAVDVLVNGHAMLGYRRAAIEQWCLELLEALLSFQNPDGGFADTRDGVRRQDGWVRGYEEPQGLSNTFATWFRWIAVAMIADLLWPGRWPWAFRRMVGIGYRKETQG